MTNALSRARASLSPLSLSLELLVRGAADERDASERVGGLLRLIRAANAESGGGVAAFSGWRADAAFARYAVTTERDD